MKLNVTSAEKTKAGWRVSASITWTKTVGFFWPRSTEHYRDFVALSGHGHTWYTDAGKRIDLWTADALGDYVAGLEIVAKFKAVDA